MADALFGASDPLLARLSNTDAVMSRAKNALSDRKMQNIDKASKDFEAMFIGEMLRPMFETVKTDETFGGGEGEDTWKSMLVDEYSKQIVNTGGIGLSDDIKTKMIEMQEAAQSVPSAPTTDAQSMIAAYANQGD